VPDPDSPLPADAAPVDDRRRVRVVVGVGGFATPLTYAVPQRLDVRCVAGVRVRVFVQTREVVGLVLGDDDGPPPSGLRQVQMVVDDAPVVTQGQMELALFVARYYFADLADAMRLVLPPDTAREVVRMLHVTDRGQQARVFGKGMGLKPADERVLAAFEPGQRIAFHTLRRRVKGSKSIDKLLDLGLLEEVAQHDVKQHRIDEVLMPLDDGEPISKRAHALAAFDAWVRNEAKSVRGAPRMSEARVAFADARGKAKRLAQMGRLELAEHGRRLKVQTALQGSKRVQLTDEQRQVIDAVWQARNDDNAVKSFLLQGVTGAGKTEVYLALVEKTLAAGQSALLVVPEIALTPQLLSRVHHRIHQEVAVLHSGMPAGERRDALHGLREGRVRVALGARSALFAPMVNLGLIVVDEEHDGSFKQADSPRYHGRDIALWRAAHDGALCVLGSATPSLESRHNADVGKLTHLHLRQRVGGGALPQVEVIDLKRRSQHKTVRDVDRAHTDGDTERVLSNPLVNAMQEALDDEGQVMLFLNKRGYASFFLCEACGTIAHCPSCSVPMTFHKKKGAAICHQCGTMKNALSSCEACGNDTLLRLGLGTERVEAEVRARFPDARVARLDRDTVRSTSDLEAVLQQMQRREIDVLIGTQMIAKGHDFPHVTLVGVVLADVALGSPDFRASERAFALLTQVAGRAGRSERTGRVLVQTFNPNHPALHFAFAHDVEGFTFEELEERRLLKYPPFWRAALLRIEGEDAGCVLSCAERAAKLLRDKGRRDLEPTTWDVLGPAPAPIEKLKNKLRMQVFVRCQSPRARAALLQVVQANEELSAALRRTNCRLILDVDPAHML